MRLGAQPTRLAPGSKAAACYGAMDISERHRHRYEFNNVYRQQFAAGGMQFAGTSPDGSLVEVIEIPDHPWFVGVQYHPEFKSQPTRSHPLVRGLHRRGAASITLVGSGEWRVVSDEQSRLRFRRLGADRNDATNATPEKKIIVDEDWKSQVEAEKEAARHAEEVEEPAEAPRRPPPAARCRRPTSAS